ncbi:hypothetical protein HYW46_04125 [Candidatus Daviesbacteria bacterium]|nr:hypothetical protein [Candidatus Daviesbacteria bacterium]
MDQLKKQKLEMWQKKLEGLQKEFKEIMVRKGEAAADGDLSENAAYKQAVEEADICLVRISEIKKIIANLEGPASAKAPAGKG